MMWIYELQKKVFLIHVCREQIIAELNENINLYEQDIAQMREQMRVRETEYEEDILKIKQQLSQGQRYLQIIKLYSIWKLNLW